MLVVATFIALAPSFALRPVHAFDPATESLALCDSVDRVPPAERAPLLAYGLALAEQAVALDGRNARAHFAVFCHLGKQMQLEGVRLEHLRTIGRLRREIDTTLQLAPDYPDALVAKGAFLLSLPWVFGGDHVEGERCLIRALELAPEHTAARLYLAHALAGRGEGAGTH